MRRTNPVNYRDPSGHGIVNKIKQGWNKVKSTAGKAWNTIKKTASGIYNKAKAGLNNYMNGSAYKSYFNIQVRSGQQREDRGKYRQRVCREKFREQRKRQPYRGGYWKPVYRKEFRRRV